MSCVYAREEGTGVRLLLRIECDAPGCTESVKPYFGITGSEWTHNGTDHGPGTEKFRWDFCPEHGVAK